MTTYVYDNTDDDIMIVKILILMIILMKKMKKMKKMKNLSLQNPTWN